MNSHLRYINTIYGRVFKSWWLKENKYTKVKLKYCTKVLKKEL
jgi:hypothetical protein